MLWCSTNRWCWELTPRKPWRYGDWWFECKWQKFCALCGTITKKFLAFFQTANSREKACNMLCWKGRVQTQKLVIPSPVLCQLCYWSPVMWYNYTYFSRGTPSAQPAISVSTKLCQVWTRWDHVYFLYIEWIHKLIQIFYSENLINSSYKTMAWRDQVLGASFSSFLSEIQFSWGCEIRMTKNIVEQNCSKEYLRHCNIEFVE